MSLYTHESTTVQNADFCARQLEKIRLTIRCFAQKNSCFPQLAVMIMQFLSHRVYVAVYCFQMYIFHGMVRYCCKLKHPTEILVIKYVSLLISASQRELCGCPIDHRLAVIQPVKVSDGQSVKVAGRHDGKKK